MLVGKAVIFAVFFAKRFGEEYDIIFDIFITEYFLNQGHLTLSHHGNHRFKAKIEEDHKNVFGPAHADPLGNL
jgi:hypothetical protein